MWGQPPSAVRPGKARFAVGLALGIALMAFGSTLAAAQSTLKPTEDLPPAPMQQKTTTACTECHEARIIVQQRLSKAAWTKEVDKMIKWGAVVDDGDRDPLIDYLSSNFNTDKPAYIAPRTSSGKTPETKSAKGASR